MIDKALSWTIVALTLAVFGYLVVLAWGNEDWLLVGLGAVARSNHRSCGS